MPNKYKLCPKCELNWIMEDQDICDICKQQLTKGSIDDEEMEEDEELVLCPICHMNYILASEEMCENCAQERATQDEPESEEVENYNYEEDAIIPADEDILVPLEEIEEEEEEEEEKAEGEFEETPEDDLDEDFEEDFEDDEDEEEEEDKE